MVCLNKGRCIYVSTRNFGSTFSKWMDREGRINTLATSISCSNTNRHKRKGDFTVPAGDDDVINRIHKVITAISQIMILELFFEISQKRLRSRGFGILNFHIRALRSEFWLVHIYYKNNNSKFNNILKRYSIIFLLQFLISTTNLETYILDTSYSNKRLFSDIN